MCQLTSEDIKHHFTLTTCSVSFPPVSLQRQVVYLLLQPVFMCSSLGRAYTVSWLVYIKVMIMLQQPLTCDSLLMLPTCFLHSPPHSPTYGTSNKCIFSYVHIYRTVKESKTQPPSILGISLHCRTYLHDAGEEMDIGSSSGCKHAHTKTRIHILQVQLHWALPGRKQLHY